MAQVRRLYRSRKNRIFLGVCGGLGEYFDLDPILVRVAFVLLALANGLGIIAYIILALLTPREEGEPKEFKEEVKEGLEKAATATAETVGRGRHLIGWALIAIGAIFLLSNLDLLWWLRWSKLWPLILIVIGAALILRERRRG